jgi:hypothetical protein
VIPLPSGPSLRSAISSPYSEKTIRIEGFHRRGPWAGPGRCRDGHQCHAPEQTGDHPAAFGALSPPGMGTRSRREPRITAVSRRSPDLAAEIHQNFPYRAPPRM